MIDRTAILENEFLRPALPGLRVLSVGVLRLARKLELSWAVTGKQHEEDDFIAAAWLLDERHSIQQIREAAELGRERFFEEVVRPYEMEMAPALMSLVKHEIKLTNEAVTMAQVIIQPKPDSKIGEKETPPGN